MIALLKDFPLTASTVQCLIELATSLLARSLQVPEPLLRVACLLMLVRIQAVESSLGKVLFASRPLRRFALLFGVAR
jgi:hypothetical protein